MKILFVFPRDKEYNSESVRLFPSGGTEKAVIFLGEAFKKLGHEVSWITTLEQMAGSVETPDIVITQEASIFEKFPDSRKVWWCHHFSDQPVIQRNAVYGRVFADAIVTLSDCQRLDFKNILRLSSTTIGHGVWLDEVAQGQKDPYRLIYASTPFRGLEKIPELFKAIKDQEPRATIAICSSMGTYGTPEQDAEYRELFDTLEAMPGVELFGALNQSALYEQFAKAKYFFYPSIWSETYCLALDEALAHGCIPVVLGLGALSERAKPAPDLTKPWEANPHSFSPKDWINVAIEWEKKILIS